ncbi:MAG TPA: rod shape-determining protein MreD [Acidimicrobiia bacterium]|nr:rod shape-determining protein MreD [Acidimicrobiia bacterium]
MRTRSVSLLLILAAVLVQTTLFSVGGIRPFRVAPDLVMVVTIVVARRLDDDAALLVGFTGGVLVDLLASSLLGWRALTLTLVAYMAVRARSRLDLGLLSGALVVLVLSFAGVILLAVVGTLFGQATLTEPDALRRIMLVPGYNFLLAFLVQPLVARAVEGKQRSRGL